MNLPMEKCPTTQMLVDFLAGNVDIESLDNISQHLERCEACLKNAETLNKERQSLFEKFLREHSNPNK